MRIFVGLDIPDDIRQRIAEYVESWRGVVPNAKWVPAASYHVTLKFIGEKPERQVEEVKRTLAEIKAPQLEVSFRGTGFFPAPKAPRVFWIGIHSDQRLPSLAQSVDQACATLGIASEKNEYRPHLTLARAGSGSPKPSSGDQPSPKLRNIADKLHGASEPDFGTMTAREFILFESKLSPRGAQYSKIARFPLQASET